MKSIKKMVAIVTAIGILSVTGAVFADSLKTPAAIAAELTGKTVTEVTQARQDGKTYGTQASEVGKLEAFQTQMFEAKKLILDQRVKDGQLTQVQADQILAAVKTNMTTCDGTGNAQIGKKMGAGFGGGTGLGCGLGQGTGKGMGGGFGRNAAQ